MADATREPLLEILIPSMAMQAGRIISDDIALQMIPDAGRGHCTTGTTAAVFVVLDHTAPAALKPLAPLSERTNHGAALRGCGAKLLPLRL